jgi:hypothetical protein
MDEIDARKNMMLRNDDTLRAVQGGLYEQWFISN